MENFATTTLFLILLALGFAGLLLLAWRYRALYRRHQVLTRQAIALRAEMHSRAQEQAAARATMRRRLQDELGTLLATVKLRLKLAERKRIGEGQVSDLMEPAELLEAAIGLLREIAGENTPQSM